MIPIVGPLPLQLINGTPQDAEQVMTLFNWIQSQTNENSIAQNIGFIPTGAITAGNVQDAIAQVPSSSGIQGLTYNMCPDTGSVNAYQGALSPAITSAGTIVFLTNIKNTNTGPSVLTVNSISGPILGMSGGALAGGEIQMGSTCAFIGMGSGSSVNWLLLKCTPGILDVSNAAADKVLGIGDIATVKFTNATSIPLHIACGDGQIYELISTYNPAVQSNSVSLLLPNNVAKTNCFADQGNLSLGSSTPSNVSCNLLYYDAFPLGGAGFYFNKTIASNLIGNKSVFALSFEYWINSPYIISEQNCTNWVSAANSTSPDTTTVWFSLGTIILPSAASGSIIIKRYA